MTKLRNAMLLCLALASALSGAPTIASTQTTDRLESLTETPPPAPTPRTLNIQAWKSLTGSKILFIRTTELPMLDLHVSFAAGSARDDQYPGLAATTFSLLNEGVQGQNLTQILETFDSLGAQLGMELNQERASFSLRTLSATNKRTPAVQLFTRILGQPLLANEALVRVKTELVDRLEKQQTQPEGQVAQAMNQLLFGTHPYAQPVYGTVQSLPLIRQEQVQDFHKKYYNPGNVLITLVGDLSLDEAQSISLQITDALPQTPTMAAPTSPSQAQSPSTSRHIESPLNQTHLMLTQQGVTRKDPDYAALKVANLIFAGSTPGSRLMKELRERRGLIYGVHMSTPNWQGHNPVSLSLQTSPEFSEGTLALIKNLFRDYLLEGPTQQELDDAKDLLRGVTALTSASNAQILSGLFDISRHDLPFDLDFTVQQALQLTTQQIKAALNRHYSTEHWNVVTLGPTTPQQALPEPVNQPQQNLCRAGDESVAS